MLICAHLKSVISAAFSILTAECVRTLSVLIREPIGSVVFGCREREFNEAICFSCFWRGFCTEAGVISMFVCRSERFLECIYCCEFIGVGIFFQISVWADAVFAGGWRLARRRERRRRWRSTRWWSRSGEERLELRFSFCTRRRRRSRIPQKSVWIEIRFSLQFSPFSSFLFRIFFSLLFVIYVESGKLLRKHSSQSWTGFHAVTREDLKHVRHISAVDRLGRPFNLYGICFALAEIT